MVKPIPHAVLAGLLPVAVLAGGSPAEEVRTAPTRFPAIRSLVVEETGAKSPADQGATDDCSRFRLSVGDAKSYLRRARRVAEHDYRHQLDWSPCYASGRVTFVDGRQAQWGIQQFGAGSLVWPDGRTVYLYCEACRRPPFR